MSDLASKMAQLEALLMELAPNIDLHLNPKKYEEGKRRIGFLLCVFDFGERGAMTYATSAQPEDLGKMLTELRAKIDETTVQIRIGDRGRG